MADTASLNVQVLVAAMHQSDESLIQKMHLQTDAIVANQCDRCSNETFSANGRKYRYLNRPDRGVGLNRNEALLHADGDVLTFADEDMVFEEGYEAVIQKAFTELPQADAIIFNIETLGQDMGRRINAKSKRVRFYNALNYGAARLSVRRTSVKRENILFHTCFGGGTLFSAGEDSLFITDMLRHGLKIYTYPVCIASVDQTTSTWFAGYNEKYFYDKGVFFKALSKTFAPLLCLQDLLRHNYFKDNNNMGFRDAYRQMRAGMKAFADLRKYQ